LKRIVGAKWATPVNQENFMTLFRKHRAAAGFGVSIVATLAAIGARAEPAIQIPRGVVLPPLSVASAHYFRAHPAEWTQFLAGLAQVPAPTARATATAGGTWTAVTKAPFNGLCNPLLLTDATVIVASCDTKIWYKLTPDNTGSYATGTWSQIASLPVIGGTQYQPQYHASAVLPDGRVIIEGGEYNGGSTGVWTNLGAIYDPLTNQWTAVAPPTGSSWDNIGDAESTVLADGTFMLASCCAMPDADALLDATTLTWTATGAPSAGLDYQDEQGYELLPNTDVLTVDIWTNANSKGNATNAERYSQSAGTWSSAGNTPVSLVDPYACGNFEIGPAVLRSDGTVVAFGGNTGCQAPTADPTAIYNYKKNTWVAGPNVPAVCGSDGTTSCSLPDSPAALLPNGNILFAASANFGGKPTHFFEYTTTNTIQQVSDPLFNSTKSGAYYYNLLVLPNGQILMTDFSKEAEVYTFAGSPVADVAPVITKAPATIVAGKSYLVHGKQLNGRSQGAYYGDDVQMATNYPIVQITNTASSHVFYARTANHSTMTVTPNARGYTHFTVPTGIETGPSSLVVIANGVASQATSVTVK
jgi:hypothetical protein